MIQRRTIHRFLTGVVLLSCARPLLAQTHATCSKRAAARGDSTQVAACQALVARAPDSAEAHDALGIALATGGDQAGAIAAWQQFVQLRPREFTGHHNLGLMYEMTRAPAPALAAFRRALPLAGDARAVQTTVWHIGVSHANLGQDSTALAWFIDASALDSTDVAAWHLAGFTASRLGQYRQAMGYWARALALAPDLLKHIQPGERQQYDAALRAAGSQQPAAIKMSGAYRGALAKRE
jgi:tetratricopeptide (TPR) repeat protein